MSAQEPQRWDYAFAGAGVAALALARELSERWPEASILLVDPRDPAEDPRVFSLWTDGEAPAGAEALASWTELELRDGEARARAALTRGWRYLRLDVDSWREAILAELDNVTWREQVVTGIEEREEGALLHLAGGERHLARWCFDSRFDERAVAASPFAQWQSFHGWRVRAEGLDIDPSRARLMDFREADDGVRFYYALPESEQIVHVEEVHTSSERRRDFDIAGYLREELGATSWEVLSEERGETLLTDAKFTRRAGAHTMRIGLAAGMARPSTGYALQRMVRDARAITTSLERHEHPFDVPGDRWRDRFLDGVLLTVMRQHPARMGRVFVALFRRNRAWRVLRLLDERASWWDILVICLTLPWLLFVPAAWRWLRARTWRLRP